LKKTNCTSNKPVIQLNGAHKEHLIFLMRTLLQQFRMQMKIWSKASLG
jgi:hypothetical protein